MSPQKGFLSVLTSFVYVPVVIVVVIVVVVVIIIVPVIAIVIIIVLVTIFVSVFVIVVVRVLVIIIVLVIVFDIVRKRMSTLRSDTVIRQLLYIFSFEGVTRRNSELRRITASSVICHFSVLSRKSSRRRFGDYSESVPTFDPLWQ